MQADDNVVRGHFDKYDPPESVLMLPDDDIAELARRHGFDEKNFDNVIFEPWLVPNGYSAVDYSGNLATIEFDPNALYFAKIEGALYPNSYVIAFSIKANFALGEVWRFDMTIHYINDADADDPQAATFDGTCEELSALVVTIRPGCDYYDMKVSGGLRIDFLVDPVLLPIQGLASLFAMRVSSLDSEPVS